MQWQADEKLLRSKISQLEAEIASLLDSREIDKQIFTSRLAAANRLLPAPDCGMKYLDRAVAFGKLKALADGAAIVRTEIS